MVQNVFGQAGIKTQLLLDLFSVMTTLLLAKCPESEGYFSSVKLWLP